MALQKDVTFSDGIVCSYIRVIQANFQFENKECVVYLAFYKDKAARQAGLQPYSSKEFRLEGDNWKFNDAQWTSNPRALIYAVLKTLDFSDAVDV